MTKRTAVIVSMVTSVTITASIFVVRNFLHDAFTFDHFAEVTINNVSGEVIPLAELIQADSTLVARNIQPGEHRPFRFERHPSSLDTDFLLTIHLADGHVFPDCGGSIGSGQKHEKRVLKDRVDTILTQAT